MTYEKPAPTMLSKIVVERFAEEVGEALCVEVGKPLEPIVAQQGGRIVYGDIDDLETDGGAIIARGHSDFEIYLSKLTSPIRDRFTIAHELGHLFLHLPAIKEANPNAVMRATRYVGGSDNDKRAEWEANWFAAALLMPSEIMSEYLQSEAEYVAARFNVSKKAAEIRLEVLKSR